MAMSIGVDYAEENWKTVFHSASVIEKGLFIALGAVAGLNLLLAIAFSILGYRAVRNIPHR